MSDQSSLKQRTRAAARARTEAARAEVEDYAITASMTLAAGFTVLAAVTDLPTASYRMAVASIVALLLALAALLWHRSRQPVRQAIWDERLAEMSYDVADKIVAFNETFVTPNLEVLAALRLPQGEREKAPAYLQTREVIVAHLRAMHGDVQAARREIFAQPLPERWGTVLHRCDRIAARLRFVLFGTGIALMVAALILGVGLR